MARATLPLDELSVARAGAIELPSVSFSKFEREVFKLAIQIRYIGLHVIAFVRPSLRTRTQKSFWAHRWNHFANPPFRLRQACSCKLGNGGLGCNLAYYFGSSFPFGHELRKEVPSLGGTPEATIASLGGALSACFSSLLTQGSGSGFVLPESSASFRVTAPALCPLVGTRAEVLRELRGDAIAGAQQTPDSAQPRVCPRADSAHTRVGPTADSARTNLLSSTSKRGAFITTQLELRHAYSVQRPSQRWLQAEVNSPKPVVSQLQVEVSSLKLAMLILLIPKSGRKLGGSNARKAEGREGVVTKRE
jgi:hypothetical protein